MITLFEFSKNISNLNKEEKYQDALRYFKENKPFFSIEQIGKNVYIISDIFKALRKTDNFNNAFKFLDFYNIKINENTIERVLTSYGWLLYSKFKADNNDNSNGQEITEDSFEDEHPVDGKNYDINKSEIVGRIESCILLYPTKIWG